MRPRPGLSVPSWLLLALLLLPAVARSQIIVAADDFHAVPFGQQLVVDSPGILDNDLVDGESASAMGAVAALVTDAQHGLLTLNPDGSFTYYPDATFDGQDLFVYAVVLGAASVQATVHLTACQGGPDVFFCWKESAFNAKAAELGYFASFEGFEDSLVWGGARTPYSLPAVTNLGIRWTSNHPDAPAFNPISTTWGAALTGNWGIFDLNHGYAEGTPLECDVNNPPGTCLYHDGFTGEAVAGTPPLVGVDGYITGTYLANINVVIDDTTSYHGGHIYDFPFFGVIDTRPTGFRRFSFVEQDGKVGQAVLVWGDDFTFLTAAPRVAAAHAGPTRFSFAGPGPNPTGGPTNWRFSLPEPAEVDLKIFDARGHLVRTLVQGRRPAGAQAVFWGGRDAGGRAVAASTYFGRLRVGQGVRAGRQVRKILILH